MKSEKQIKEKLELYQWYFENVVETKETKGYIEALKWVIEDEIRRTN